MTRRGARELALQTLFSIEVGKHDPSSALDAALQEANLGAQRAFVRELVFGTLDHAEGSDAAMAPLLEGWTVERIPTVDRLILRMSLFELLHDRQTPRAVVINEAVELAKKFSTEDSGRFINGVLANAGGTA
ncbi:MAG: transcription antitermination factor NusB [Candidatus Eremiobacteraeota bacterium]|nr:transcription antitermination factor NusB [Candidatus Eremiobacteraeota bacterium]